MTLKNLSFLTLEQAVFETRRKRRDGSKDEISAVFESVFNVLGEKDAAEESGLAEASQIGLTDSIKDEVETFTSDLTQRTVGDQGGYLAGELNFFRRAAAEDIEEPVMELLVVARVKKTTVFIVVF